MPRRQNALPSQEYLRRRLDYDPDTGQLTWRVRPVSDFEGSVYPPERLAASWMTRFCGKPALAFIDPGSGYSCGAIDGNHVTAGRVIWKWMTGEEPDTIDHENGVRHDNRWVNLRNGSSQHNSRNMKRFSNNKTGVTGVFFEKRRGLFRAEIKVNYRSIFLGYFPTVEAAAAVRYEAERIYGFFAGHGRA